MTSAHEDGHARRSRETQQKLLAAAIEGLVLVGYEGLTIRWVAAHAGVTRGALQHHYRSKAELLGAAIGHLGQLSAEHVRTSVRELPEDDTRVEVFVDLLWGLHGSPLFTAAFEVWCAARTDPDLRRVIDRVGAELAATLADAATTLGPLAERDGFALDLEQTVSTMRGLAMRSLITPDDPRVASWEEMRPRLVRILRDGG